MSNISARRLTRALLTLERLWTAMPHDRRVARTLGWFGLVAGGLGLVLLPLIGLSASGPIAWALVIATLVGGALLVVLPRRVIDLLPSWVVVASALGDQTGFVLATGDADSPFLPGYTAIVLVTAMAASLRLTVAAFAVATGSLLALGAEDAAASTAAFVRTVVDALILLAAAVAVSHLAWRRRIAISRASRRLVRARASARFHQRASEIDALTGVGNRRAFEMALAGIEASGRLDAVVLMVIDVDGLKSINDRLGHEAGDAALRSIAAGVAQRVRPGDRLYRTGGEEFVAIVERPASAGIAGRLGDSVEVDVPGVGRVSASVGFAQGAPGTNSGELLRLADQRMYGSKRAHPFEQGPAA